MESCITKTPYYIEIYSYSPFEDFLFNDSRIPPSKDELIEELMVGLKSPRLHYMV